MATRWGCLGPGKISHDFFLAIQENLPAEEHEFVCVASRSLERSQKFADQFKFKRAYDSYDEVAKDKDVEVVYIGTLHTTHVELAMKMLNAGKHVLCEKPMAMNYKQAKQVLDLAKEKKLFFLEGVWSRFFPSYQKLKKELADGKLGDVRLLEATFCVPISQVDRVNDLKLGGGGLLDIGIYLVQLACFVFNEMPEKITARAGFFESGPDRNGCIILEYKSGAMASLTYHTEVLNKNTACVCGTAGRVELEGPFWCPTKILTPAGPLEFPLKHGEYYFTNSAGFQYEAAAVRDCLLKGKTEHEFVRRADSEMIHKILDEVRRQIGLKYPDFD